MKYMKKNLNLRIFAGDPARSNDPFGEVGAEATWPKKEIHYKYAREFKRQPYGLVAKYFKLHQKIMKPHVILLESNFEKDKVQKEFTRNGVPVQWVYTSANLTEENKKDFHNLDKPFVVEWLASQRRLKRIFYARNIHNDIEELVTQTNNIGSFMTQNGGTTYRAMRGRHDDLFMASLIIANYVRLWWDELDE